MTLVDTQAAAVAAGVDPATIRSWARRNQLAQHGTDHKRRTLYDLAEVYKLAREKRARHAAMQVGQSSTRGGTLNPR